MALAFGSGARIIGACALSLVFVAACGDADVPVPSWPPGPGADIEKRVEALLAQMTLEEKVEQMHGSAAAVDDLWPTPDNARLGIPGFRMVDGPRGVRAGKATTFPVGMARGATWDPALEERVGEAMGAETAAKGGNVLLAPTINILRHPAWGRAQETYGEDTVHLGAMGAAFITGAQKHVLASVKHFAANSIEDKRFVVDVQMDERTLREVYLPHFEKAVRDAHAASVMSAYNKVNGLYCSENPHLLHDVLGEWGFDGFVESDWFLGTHTTVDAALAGLDIEMPGSLFFGQALLTSAEAGDVPVATIDEAVRRILRKKLEFALDAPAALDPGAVESAEHVALTREVEREALVLLKNDGAALPLDGATSIAVVGPLADVVNLGDEGSSNSVPSHAVTPLAGIQARAGATQVMHVPGPVLSAADETVIANASAAIVVVGLTAEDEGEYLGADKPGGDRHSKTLELSGEAEALIHAVAAKSPRTIVVLEGGSAIVVRSWVDEVGAVLMAWYPGQEGGVALADVLFGDVSPSGKLPISFPRSAIDLPPFVNDQDQVTYDFLHGYRWLEAQGTEPEFPFGFGMSYASFEYAGLELDATSIAPDGSLTATVQVTNTSERAADEIVQLYVGCPGSSVLRAPKDLKAFARVHLEAGEAKPVALEIRARDLAYWSTADAAWRVEPMPYVVEVGASSREPLLSATFTVAP